MGRYIHINYGEVRAVARELREQAEVIQRIINAMSARVSQMSEQWIGMAEVAFLDEFQSCHRRMSRIPGMLSRLSGALQYAADRIEEAEREAERAAHETVTADN